MDTHYLLAAFLLTAIVLLFDFINGFNDGANMMVSPVVTGALRPWTAVFLFAVFEFIGAWFLGTAVAQTLGRGIVNPDHISLAVIFAALGGAIVWTLGGWFFGLPSSSSHALIGGLLGAAAVDSGFKWIHWPTVSQVLIILVLAPIFGLIAARYLTRGVLLLLGGLRPSRANRLLRRLEILASIFLAMSYGSNDAQKGMGMISLGLLLFYGMSPKVIGRIYQPLPGGVFYVPHWVILACSLALALGASTGGWRIMKTLGSKLYRVRPVHGFSAQACSAIIIRLSSWFGFPVSTTQIVSSSILGAGSAQTLGSVRWRMGWQIFLTWIVTIPGTAVLSALLFLLINGRL